MKNAKTTTKFLHLKNSLVGVPYGWQLSVFGMYDIMSTTKPKFLSTLSVHISRMCDKVINWVFYHSICIVWCSFNDIIDFFVWEGLDGRNIMRDWTQLWVIFVYHTNFGAHPLKEESVKFLETKCTLRQNKVKKTQIKWQNFLRFGTSGWVQALFPMLQHTSP